MSEAREQDVFSREVTPAVERVWAAFLHHAGLSFRRVGNALGHSHEAVRQWYHRLSKVFEPKPDNHRLLAVDETTVQVEAREVYAWAARDVETFEAIHVEVSPG